MGCCSLDLGSWFVLKKPVRVFSVEPARPAGKVKSAVVTVV